MSMPPQSRQNPGSSSGPTQADLISVRVKAAALLLAVLLLMVFFSDGLERILANRLFDLYQTMMPRERSSAPAIIVAIDEESLKAQGQWPWPRTRVALLLDKIVKGHPAAVGIDIIFAEEDRFSPGRLPDALPNLDSSMRRALMRLPSPDRVLAASLQKGPFVLGMAGLEEGDNHALSGITPMRARGGDPAAHLRNYPGILRSIPVLDGAASGRGLLSIDMEEGIARRLPLLATVGGQAAPTLSLALLQIASRKPVMDVKVDARGIVGVAVGDLFVPTTPDGRLWVRYGSRDKTRFVSATDLLSGRVDPKVFENRLVLVGFTGLGLLDFVATPVGERMPGIEVHAQILENIFENSWLSRPGGLRAGEFVLLGILGLVMVLLTPALRPGWSAILWAIMVSAVLGAGVVLFHTGFLFDGLTPALGVTAVYGMTLAMTLVMTERLRRVLQSALALEREEKARVEGEMAAARQVQMGMLPTSSSLPVDDRFELAAFMEPARQVGGDLYDFFLLTGDRLFFLVGDVSGKGLPASLFMVMSKALCKSITLRADNAMGVSPAEILTRTNVEASRDNPDLLFVTALAGELDLESGLVAWGTAGHDEPYRLVVAEGRVDQIRSDPGPPLCAVEDYQYRPVSVQMQPGDMLVIITDGITEAQDETGHFYGADRLTACLSRLTGAQAVQTVVDGLLDDVRAFVGKAEPADDLTILALRWRGPGAPPSAGFGHNAVSGQ
jgi:adenylate cyclase